MEVLGAMPWWPIVALTLISAGIVAPLTIRTLRRPTADDRSNDNLYTAGLRIAGGALIFIGSFGAVSIWQAQRDFDQRFAKELQTAVNLVQQASFTDDALGAEVAALLIGYGMAVEQQEVMESGELERSDDADEVMFQLGQVVSAEGTPNRDELMASYTALSNARTDRLAWQSSLGLGIIIPALVLAFVTLVLIGLYPAGRGREAKVIQATLMTVVVVCVLGMVVIVASPAFNAAETSGDLRLFLGSLGR